MKFPTSASKHENSMAKIFSLIVSYSLPFYTDYIYKLYQESGLKFDRDQYPKIRKEVTFKSIFGPMPYFTEFTYISVVGS